MDDPLNINLFKQVEQIGFPLTFHLAPQLGGYYGCYDAISRDPEFGYKFLEEFQDRLYWGTDIDTPTVETPIVPYFKKWKEQ